MTAKFSSSHPLNVLIVHMADVEGCTLTSQGPWCVRTGPVTALSGPAGCREGAGSANLRNQEVNELVEGVSECDLGLGFELVERLRARGFGVPPSALTLQPAKVTFRSKRQGHSGACASRSNGRSWSALPDDVLLLICGLVSCQDWQRIACTSAAWRATLSGNVHNFNFDWAGHQVNQVATGASILFTAVLSASFQRCTALTDDSLTRFVKGSCVQLQALDLSGCRKVTDKGIVAIAHCCPRLQDLNISSCHLVTDEGFGCLGRCCRHLRTLKACGCDRLHDHGLQALVASPSRLEELNLGWCDHLGDASLTVLAANCSQLRILDLCGCSKVTDRAVEVLAAGCPQLHTLGLYCCRALSDASMRALASHLTGLQHINVSGCRRLTPAALQAVLDANPHLHTCRNMCCNVILGGCLALLDVRCRCNLDLS